MLSYNMTSSEIEELNPDTAVLAFASIEQHGSHLPVSTDFLVTEAFSATIAEQLDAFLIPTMPISNCREHMGKKGSVWMNPDTLYHMVIDICHSLKEQGFKKVVIIQGHGGIFVLMPAVRQLNATLNPDLMVCCLQYYDYIDAYRKAGIIESDVCIHADEIETSVMMYLHPGLVREDRILDYVPEVKRPYLNYGSIFCASSEGVWGRPSYASAKKGEKIFKMGIELMKKEALDAFSYMINKQPIGYSDF